MAFDYSKLVCLIKQKYATQEKFARELGIGRVSLSQRLNNHLDFTAEEIAKAIKLLNISKKMIPTYFFEEKVQKCEHPEGL